MLLLLEIELIAFDHQRTNLPSVLSNVRGSSCRASVGTKARRLLRPPKGTPWHFGETREPTIMMERRLLYSGRLPSRVPQGDEPRRRTQITLPLPFRSISPAPIIASMPLRLLLKTLQCFFTKQVRVPLACFGELDDLVGDDLVSNRIVINFYPSISKRGANQLIRYSHNAHGLRIE
jgi:hypothetical protein